MESSYPGVAPPPPGVVPDLQHPQDGHRALLVGWLATSIAVSSFFFFMRAYGKLFVLKSVVREDSRLNYVSCLEFTADLASSNVRDSLGTKKKTEVIFGLH